MYLEIEAVYNEEVEVSLFSSPDSLFEIYISYGRLYGIICAESEKAYQKYEEIKKELTHAHKRIQEPTDQFINLFCKKHKVSLPDDIFFHPSKFLSSK